MKAFVLTAALFICVGFASSALAKTTSIPSSDPVATIDFPDDWKVTSIDMSVHALAPQGDLLVVAQEVVTGTKATKKDIDETFDQSLGESLEGFKMKDKPLPAEATTIDGIKGYKCTAKGTYKNAAATAVSYWIPINEDTGLTITYVDTDETTKKHQDMVKKLIESIHRKAK